MLEIHSQTLDDAKGSMRGNDYYNPSSVTLAIETAQRDACANKAYQFLVKYRGVIVGRDNLSSVARSYYNKASLGYRFGQGFGGNGHATKAAELVLAKARTELDFWRIEATVRLDNHGSARVLLNNDFLAYGTTQRSMKLHGVWYDLRHFERNLASCASARRCSLHT